MFVNSDLEKSGPGFQKKFSVFSSKLPNKVSIEIGLLKRVPKIQACS